MFYTDQTGGLQHVFSTGTEMADWKKANLSTKAASVKPGSPVQASIVTAEPWGINSKSYDYSKVNLRFTSAPGLGLTIF
jgi:hypothetical protein